jgi:sugar (pentulose or hexulose) kinase
MGGREFDLLTGGRAVEPDAAAVASVIERGIMAWPSFVRGSGPFPDAAGGWSHDPASLTDAERTAVASLYAALMTASCLDLLGASGPTAVEGPFARNDLYRDALGRLTGRPVVGSPGTTGTGAGAALLFATAPSSDGGASLRPERPGPPSAPFVAYAARWREMARVTAAPH